MLSKVHKLNDNQDLQEEIYSLITKGEGYRAKPYFDIKQVPTIGYGVNLEVKGYDTFAFNSMGITDSKHQESLTKVINDTKNEFLKELKDVEDEGKERKAEFTKDANERILDNFNYKYKQTYGKEPFTAIDMSKTKRETIDKLLKDNNITEEQETKEYVKIWEDEKKSLDVLFKNTDKETENNKANIIKESTKDYDKTLRDNLTSKLQELTNDKTKIFELTEKQAEEITRTIINGKQKDLDGKYLLKLNDESKKLGLTPLIADKNSNEYIALMDMYYNAETLVRDAKKLQSALETDNRPEAWYQIRYNSNKEDNKGLANRRAAQSNLFELYNDKDNVTIEEAKNVLKMVALHKEDIVKDETKSNSKEAYKGNNSILKQLEPSIKALGKDIDQEFKLIIEDIKSSIEPRVLKLNDKGEHVKELQERLNILIKEKHLSLKELKEDGVFGKATKEALEEFQTKESLTADGIFGSKSKEALDKRLEGIKESKENISGSINQRDNSNDIKENESNISSNSKEDKSKETGYTDNNKDNTNKENITDNKDNTIKNNQTDIEHSDSDIDNAHIYLKEYKSRVTIDDTEGKERLVMKGFNSNEAQFLKQDKDLKVIFQDISGSVTIKDYEYACKIESFCFDDKILEFKDIEQRLQEDKLTSISKILQEMNQGKYPFDMNASDITKEASLEQLIIAELGEAPSKEGAQRTRDNMEAMAKEKQKQKELEEQKEKDKDKNKDDDDNLHRQ